MAKTSDMANLKKYLKFAVENDETNFTKM